jgi:hypothetical protein
MAVPRRPLHVTISCVPRLALLAKIISSFGKKSLLCVYSLIVFKVGLTFFITVF